MGVCDHTYRWVQVQEGTQAVYLLAWLSVRSDGFVRLRAWGKQVINLCAGREWRVGRESPPSWALKRSIPSRRRMLVSAATDESVCVPV